MRLSVKYLKRLKILEKRKSRMYRGFQNLALLTIPRSFLSTFFMVSQPLGGAPYHPLIHGMYAFT